MNIGVTDNDLCPICGTHEETGDHLFFSCEFSRKCVDLVRHWLTMNWNVRDLKDLYRKRHMPRNKVKIITAIMGNLIYAIWRTRNEAVWQMKVATACSVVDTVIHESRVRLNHLSWSTPIHNWIKEL